MKLAVALAVAFGVGAACRWFDVPAPAPPKLTGALLVLAMTAGYIVADLARARSSDTPAATDTRDE